MVAHRALARSALNEGKRRAIVFTSRQSLHRRIHTAFAAPFDSGFSFLGVRFDDAVIARVRITSGSALLGQLDDEFSGDAVVMDDFFYGEPQQAAVPEPATLTLLGIAALGAVRRRRRCGQ